MKILLFTSTSFIFFVCAKVNFIAANADSSSVADTFLMLNASLVESLTEVSRFFPQGNSSLFSNATLKCLEDFKYFVRHLNSKWSMQMLDAAGKLPSGTLLGNLLWMGKYRECLDVHVPDNGSTAFNGLYCVATWSLSASTDLGLPLKKLPVKTGLCLPSSCSRIDMEKDIKSFIILLHRLPLLKEYKKILDLTALQCKEDNPKISNSALLYLYFLGAYFLLLITGSMVTVVHYVRSSLLNVKLPSEECQMYSNFVCEVDEFHSNRSALPHAENRIICPETESIVKEDYKNGVVTRGLEYLKCFCVFSNARKLLDTKQTGRQFPCIHGIRVISMAWIILGHTYIHNTDIIGNYVDLLKGIDNFPFQIILQGTFSVDTFFLISGFLLCYMYLEEADKRRGKINLFILILHRFLRLTPVYMLLITYHVILFKYTGSGPFWGDDSDVSSCEKYWWWNLLYINNFLPLQKMCISWTWYLANDMQFFLICVLLLHILWRFQCLGISLICSLMMCSWIVTWCISYSYDIIPLFVGISTATDYETYRNKLLESWNVLYTKPYCRIGPYLIGFLTSYILYRKKYIQWNLKWLIKLFGWVFSLFCSMSVIFGVYHMSSNSVVFSFYNALARTAFSLGVSWVIFCCLTGNAVLINRILSSKMWVPLSRLTYCAYLFHPMIMSWYFDSQKVPLYFTHSNMVMLYLGFLIASYTVAFAVSVLFETPIILLEKMFKKKA